MYPTGGPAAPARAAARRPVRREGADYCPLAEPARTVRARNKARALLDGKTEPPVFIVAKRRESLLTRAGVVSGSRGRRDGQGGIATIDGSPASAIAFACYHLSRSLSQDSRLLAFVLQHRATSPLIHALAASPFGGWDTKFCVSMFLCFLLVSLELPCFGEFSVFALGGLSPSHWATHVLPKCPSYQEETYAKRNR